MRRTKTPFYAYPYDRQEEVEFSIRFVGLDFHFYCRKARRRMPGIRKARALLIRAKVITAQPSQYWHLNAKRTQWKFCAATDIGPVPSTDVYWALSNNRNLIETYHVDRTIQWEIRKTIVQCYKCDTLFRRDRQCWHGYIGRGAQPALLSGGKWLFWTPLCDKCVSRFDKAFHEEIEGKRPFQSHWDLISRPELDAIASQDRSMVARWVRRFISAGHHTPEEFRALCEQHRNVCLRCGKKLPLVADHVIPIAKGGTDDISNIQPLCARCNGIKCDKATDYRKRRRPLPPLS